MMTQQVINKPLISHIKLFLDSIRSVNVEYPSSRELCYSLEINTESADRTGLLTQGFDR